MVKEGVDSSDVGPTDSWVKGLEIRYLEPMKIWRIVTQSQIKGDIDPHSAVYNLGLQKVKHQIY